MSALAIVVSFSVLAPSEAVYCTQPMPIEDARTRLEQMIPNGDFKAWRRAHPGVGVPGVIARGHPNYNDALSGKTVDNPDTDETHVVPPCKPFPE